MDPDQIDRAADAAKKYVNTKMQTADLIAIASLSTNMRLISTLRTQGKNSCRTECYNSDSGQDLITVRPAARRSGRNQAVHHRR